MAFIDSTSERDRANKTTVVCDCIVAVRDVRSTLGDDWYEVERQARVEDVSVGTVLGRLAQAALTKGGKK